MLTYTELSKIQTFEDRFEYLKLGGVVGKDTFGFDRYLNQEFYRSNEWRRVRNLVIIRDNGCDLGILGREVRDKIIIHHMNPINIDDFRNATDFLLNPEFLICTSHRTHNAIHYGNESLLLTLPKERSMYDTCPWKKIKNEERG